MRVAWLLLALFLSPQLARAACATPAGVAGQLNWTGTAMQFCNNTSWVTVNSTSTGVACTQAGQIQYSSSEILFCDGTVLRRTAPVTNYGTCTAGSAGQFYYSTADTYYWFCNGANWRRMGP